MLVKQHHPSSTMRASQEAFISTKHMNMEIKFILNEPLRQHVVVFTQLGEIYNLNS